MGTLEGETDLAEKGVKSRTNGVETELAPCSCIVSAETVQTEAEIVFGTVQVEMIPDETALNTILNDGDNKTEVTKEMLVETMRTDPNYLENEMFKSALEKIVQLLRDQGKISSDDVVTFELRPLTTRRRRQSEDILQDLAIVITKTVDNETGTEEQVLSTITQSLEDSFNSTNTAITNKDLYKGEKQIEPVVSTTSTIIASSAAELTTQSVAITEETNDTDDNVAAETLAPLQTSTAATVESNALGKSLSL